MLIELGATRTRRLRRPAIAEQSRFMSTRATSMILAPRPTVLRRDGSGLGTTRLGEARRAQNHPIRSRWFTERTFWTTTCIFWTTEGGAAICALMSTRPCTLFWRTKLAYTTRRRRLSSITRAPCRKVVGAPGQRWHAARNVASATLIVFDAGDVLHDAFAVSGPHIDTEGEVSSQRTHLRPLYTPFLLLFAFHRRCTRVLHFEPIG